MDILHIYNAQLNCQIVTKAVTIAVTMAVTMAYYCFVLCQEVLVSFWIINCRIFGSRAKQANKSVKLE